LEKLGWKRAKRQCSMIINWQSRHKTKEKDLMETNYIQFLLTASIYSSAESLFPSRIRGYVPGTPGNGLFHIASSIPHYISISLINIWHIETNLSYTEILRPLRIRRLPVKVHPTLYALFANRPHPRLNKILPAIKDAD
jgi:hypothetical protein